MFKKWQHDNHFDNDLSLPTSQYMPNITDIMTHVNTVLNDMS